MDPEDVGCKDAWVLLNTGLTEHGPASCRRVVIGRQHKTENHRPCKWEADAERTGPARESNKVAC